MRMYERAAWRVLWCLALVMLGFCCSCNHLDSRVLAEGKDSMTIGEWKRISLGRSDLMVPAGARVVMKGEVNEVELMTVPLAGGKTLNELWKDRLVLVSSGKGWPNGQTSIKKEYPGLRQIYYATGSDAEMLVNLERWVQIGSTVVKAVTEFDPKYLSAVERNMDLLFAHAVIGGTPRAGDFVIDDLIISLPMDGRESVDADIDFDVPATAPASAAHVKVTVSEQALKTAGNVTVLSRIGEAKRATEGVSVQVVRSGRKSVGVLAGEESVLAFKKNGSERGGMRAEWESGGLANNQKAPQTSVLLVAEETAHPDLAGLTGCWDHLLTSLSFR